MLSTNSRKTIATFVAGAFILAGIASPLIVQAASASKERPAHYQCRQQINPEQAAKRLAADYGLDEALIAKYQKEGKHFKDLRQAAFFAKVSDKSFESVLALKTDKNSWKEVAATLGIDKEKAKAVRQELAARHMAEKYAIDQGDIQALFNQGYHYRDIAMAGLLAKQSGQPIDIIMAKKKVNNTWQDVGREIGIDLKGLKKDMRKSCRSNTTKE